MIYFNEFLINDDAIASLTNHYKLFTDNFYLGATASNTFELSCGKQFIQLQPNKVLIDDGINSFHLYVDNMKEDGAFFKYTLTDKMLNFNFKYSAEELIENNREYGQSTTTIQDILEDICLKANVECSYTIQSTNHIIDWWDDRLLARDYISFIAAKEGGFARIDENDELVIIPHNSLSKQTINTEDIEELTVGEHTIISRVVHDNGVHKWEFGDATGRTIYLDTSNVFILEEEDVEYIYNQINGFEFYSVNVSNCIFNPEIRAGDVITFKHGDDEYPTIAQYSTSFAGGQWVGSVNLDIKTIKQEETSILNVSDSVKAINTYIDRLNNEFGIIAEEIEKLTDYIRNVGTTGNYVKLPDTPKSFGAINKLSIKGFELMPLYPGMAYPSEYTYPGVLSFYTLIFDTLNTFDNEPNYVFINSPIPLQKLGTVYDELIIEANKVKVIQRIGYDDVNEEWSVLSNPITHELNDVLLPTFDGDTFVTVKYFTNLSYQAEYLIKNDLTSNFTTQLESSSQFKINQDEIEAKVNKDGIISSINLSPEEIKILAEKLKLEGYTTINDGFSVDLDGNVTMNNATINGSTLKLADNTDIVGGNGILSQLQYKSDMQLLGIGENMVSGVSFEYAYLVIACYIPDNFTIRNANLSLTVLDTANTYWGNLYDAEEPILGYGQVKNIKAFKQTNASSWHNAPGFGWFRQNEPTGNEIVGVLGADGFTNPNTGEYTVTSGDIKEYLEQGLNKIFFRTINEIPNSETVAGVTSAVEQTQFAETTLTLIGFTK